MKNKLSKPPKAGVILPILFLAVALVIPLFTSQQYMLGILISTMIMMYYCSAWNIIGGYAGQFALGNAVYVGIGAYVTGICFNFENISPWIAMFIGAAVSLVIAFIISLPCFKLSGTYFALASIAFLQVARMIMVGTPNFLGWKTNGGRRLTIPWRGGFAWMQFKDKQVYYYIILAMLVVVLLVSAYIKRSKIGMYLAAIQTNQGAASTIGVNVARYKMTAQAISAIFLSIGGSFFAIYISMVDPYKVLGLELSMNIMMYTVIGGLGSLWGPVIGAGVLSLLSEFLRVQVSTEISLLSTVIFGVVLMLVILFSPTGLVGIIAKFTGMFKRKQPAVETVKNDSKGGQ